MSTILKKLTSVAVLAGVVFTLNAASGGKKAIMHSWGNMWADPSSIEKNLDKLDKLPFDGTTMTAKLREPGKEPRQALLFLSDAPYSKEPLKETLRIWKLAAKKLPNNLAITMWEPKNRLDWKDDKAWKRAEDNIGIIAWLVHEAGMKGILVDPEDYPKSGQYYLSGNEDFAEISALARKRGAQLMRRMTKECPELTLFCFYLLSNHPALWNYNKDPLYTAEATGNLWPSFVNGLLDALPPTAQIVDGVEYGYALEFDVHGFYRLGNDVRQKALPLVAPENQDKYRKQVKIAFGLYLDVYPKLTKYPTKLPFDGSIFKRMINNFCQAQQVADEFCWYYGERRHFFKWGWNGEPEQDWDETIPGLYDAIRLAKDPVGRARQWLDENRAKGTLPKSLIANPEATPNCSEKTHREFDWLPAGPAQWWCWQYRNGNGSFSLDRTTGHGDNFSAKITGVGRGCLNNTLVVNPGDFYIIESYCKGGRHPYVEIRWQQYDEEGKVEWITTFMDQQLVYDKTPDANGWRRAVGVVNVPVRARRMVVHHWDNLTPNSQETVWFDSINVYKMNFGK